MNSIVNILIILVGILAILGLLYLLYQLLVMNKERRLEKRFAPFTIAIIEDDNEPLFDTLLSNYHHLQEKVSKVLLKIKIFNSYSNKYEKYNYKASSIDNMNYITDKLFIGLGLVILLLLSSLFKIRKIDWLLILLVFLIGFFSLDIYLLIKEKLRKNKIEKDLSKAIMIMNSAFKSGYSIMQAINLIYTELDGPISDEFKKMYMDITFGLNMEVVFNRFAERVDCVEARYMATSLAIVNKTGGNIIQVFKAVERDMQARKKLKEELESVSASSRAMYKILICIPIFLVLMLLLLNPSYFVPLFNTPIGILCLIASIVIYVLYIIIIRKIVNVEVKL